MPATASDPCSAVVREAVSDALWALSQLQVREEWACATGGHVAEAVAACRRVIDLLSNDNEDQEISEGEPS